MTNDQPDPTDTIRGHADGLEAEPVWETPLPDGHHADTVAAILEAVRNDWRDAPAPASGYRLELEYDPATGALTINMGAADPNEEPPADLIAPLPFRNAAMPDYWPDGPYDHEAAAAALPDDAAERMAAAMGIDPSSLPPMLDGAQLAAKFADDRERIFRSLGIDRNDPATAALLEEVGNDGFDFHAARAEWDRRGRAIAAAIPESMPLDALPAGAEMAQILRANGMDPDNYRIVYGPPAIEHYSLPTEPIDLSGGDPDPATNPHTELFQKEPFKVIKPTEREEHDQ